jgi:hypothetical protein
MAKATTTKNDQGVERDGPEEDFSRWTWKSTEVEDLYRQIRIDAAQTVMAQITKDMMIELEVKDRVAVVCAWMFEAETMFRIPLAAMVEYFIDTRATHETSPEREHVEIIVAAFEDALGRLRAALG